MLDKLKVGLSPATLFAGLVLPLTMFAQTDEGKPAEKICKVEVIVRAFDGSKVASSHIVFARDENLDSKPILQGDSDVDGVFTATLKAGDYHLRVVSTGFRSFEKYPIKVTCESTSVPFRVAVRMEIGETR